MVVAGVVAAEVEVADGCQRVLISHPMTKQDHLAYILAVGDDLVRIKRLYPEQEAQASFRIQGPASFYAFCTEHGLFKL